MPEAQTLLDFSVIAVLFHVVISPLTALHALMFKRDSRAALGWIALCLLLPVAGPVLYTILGINRIRRRARRLELPGLKIGFERGRARRAGAEDHPELPDAIADLEHIGAQLSAHPLSAGNAVQALRHGDEAYPEMLAAIERAERSVFLCSYILDADETGRAFADALERAQQRGADVRVIVDGVGQYYTRPRAVRWLRRRGLRARAFLPPSLLPPRLSLNLRNHHKILVVDGRQAFTGGMNIGDRHVVGESPARAAVADLHFRLDGPVAAQLEAEFLRTWEFITGVRDAPAPVQPKDTGPVWCRTLTDGPDEDLDQITLLLGATIARAQRSVLIMTPYFLPPRELIGALQAASLRGVEVVLVLPAVNNLPFVHWATRNMLWELLYQGIEVFYQPAPFNHAKLLVIDDCYTLVGSSNWDSRSLRLNFELQVEAFDAAFARDMAGRLRAAAASGRPVSLEEVDNRSLPERLRDSFFWLFSPYL
jgi:cardiolipin synthase